MILRVVGLLFLFSIADAYCAVRQRSFVHDGKGTTTGTESIVHWDFSSAAKVEMHNWGSSTLASSSTITFSAAKTLFGSSIGQWVGGIHGVLPAIQLNLDLGDPFETSSGCEATTGGLADAKNNIVFTSKLNTSCSTAIPSGYGVIGLTKVRYAISSGVIAEADLQFDDNTFKFKTTGVNDFVVDTINLNDVATHELGHFFGLDHAAVREASMIFSVAEDLEIPKEDDFSGLLSIYPPSTASSQYGTLQGSLTDSSLTAIFGAVVFAINPRTMRVVASEITDVNGNFKFCAIPYGSYMLLANRYMPYGSNIHKYYSGDGEGSAIELIDGVSYCANPSCAVMNRNIEHSPLSHAVMGAGAAGGIAMSVVKVDGTASDQFVNLTAQSTPINMDLVSGSAASPGSTIQLDEPRLARLALATLALNGSGSMGSDFYSFTAPASGSIIVRTASLRIFARLQLSLVLYNSSGASVSCSNTATVLTATDAEISCTGLTGGAAYHVGVSGVGVSCRLIPGNFFGNSSESCENSEFGEEASTAIPFYLINVFAAANENDMSLGDAGIYESVSKGAQSWMGMPTCSSYVGNVSKGSSGGSCCGSLGGVGPERPDGPKSFLLGLLLSPLLWFVAAWSINVRQIRASKKEFQI